MIFLVFCKNVLAGCPWHRFFLAKFTLQDSFQRRQFTYKGVNPVLIRSSWIKSLIRILWVRVNTSYPNTYESGTFHCANGFFSEHKYFIRLSCVRVLRSCIYSETFVLDIRLGWRVYVWCRPVYSNSDQFARSVRIWTLGEFIPDDFIPAQAPG